MFDIDIDIKEIEYTDTIETDEYYGIIFMFDNIIELDGEFLKNLFKKPSLEFISLVPGLASIKEIQPKPAKDFIPQWWKNLPSTTDERGINTFKKCPMIPELYDRG